jgi:hypothetical protein
MQLDGNIAWRTVRATDNNDSMSKLIPGHASPAFRTGAPRLPVAAPASTCVVNARQQPGFGKPGCVTFADGHKPFFSLQPRTSS